MNRLLNIGKELNRQTKLKAFTLMELTVTMIISSIVIASAGTAINMVTSQYGTFQRKNDRLHDLNQFNSLLYKDFLRYEHIEYNSADLELKLTNSDGIGIVYNWEEERVIRNHMNLVIDTFPLIMTEPEIVQNELGQLSELHSVITYRKHEFPLMYRKVYAPSEILNSKEFEQTLRTKH